MTYCRPRRHYQAEPVVVRVARTQAAVQAAAVPEAEEAAHPELGVVGRTSRQMPATNPDLAEYHSWRCPCASPYPRHGFWPGFCHVRGSGCFSAYGASQNLEHSGVRPLQVFHDHDNRQVFREPFEEKAPAREELFS